MKIKTLLSLCVVLVFLSYFTSCDSSSYEIEEVEVYEEDTSKIAQNTDIKQEIETPKNEIKDDALNTRKSPPVKYTIQIGAFIFESNAIGYLKRARETFAYQFDYKKINGLYKIRIINIFDTQEEAMPYLEKIKDAGFDDSFITEAGK